MRLILPKRRTTILAKEERLSLWGQPLQLPSNHTGNRKGCPYFRKEIENFDLKTSVPFAQKTTMKGTKRTEGTKGTEILLRFSHFVKRLPLYTKLF
jgi:hypothetical protein